jgi:hypothetical protein
VAGAVIILAVAGDGEVGIDGDVVIGLAVKGGTVKGLTGETGFDFVEGLEAFTNDIAEQPVEPSFLFLHRAQELGNETTPKRSKKQGFWERVHSDKHHLPAAE